MRNFISTIKTKINATKVAVAGSIATLAGIPQAYCLKDANGMASSILVTIFNFIKFGGIVLLAIGIVKLIKTAISMAGGDQTPPQELAKDAAMVLGGIALLMAQTLVESVTGESISNLTLM